MSSKDNAKQPPHDTHVHSTHNMGANSDTPTTNGHTVQEHTKTDQELASEFRKFLPDTGIERFQRAASQTPEEYGQYFDENRAPPWLHELVTEWRELIKEPFKGVTTDGEA